MSDETPILSLPLILPAQAQKHVTHNEALRLLDVLVQCVVTDRNRTAPPATPEDGDRHIIGAGATGEWEGRAGWIAAFWAGGWLFIAPQRGWTARVLSENRVVVYGAAGWVTEGGGAAQGAETFGINAAADATNRLTVAAAATLLTHDGAGHQLKLNKASAGETASLLFQTGWGGRAEMGTVGSDDFRIRVSADGASFADGAVFSAASGQARLVSGATVPDGSAAEPALAFDAESDTGLFRPASDALGLTVGGAERARLTAEGYLRFAAGSGGIQFDGNDGAGRALDAYEEGSFTPVAQGSTSAGTAAYLSQSGRFTRIGNRVFFSVHLAWSGHTGTGDLVVAGLPVPAVGAAGGFAAMQLCPSGISFGSGAQPCARIAPGGWGVDVLQAVSGGPITPVALPVSAGLTLSGQYEV